MVYRFLKKLTDFGGNCDFGEVLCFRLFLDVLGYRWAIFGFSDTLELHSSATVPGFLES